MQMGMSLGGKMTTPILDTRNDCVGFDCGEVRKLTENVIAESMYTAFDDSGNEYLMMDSIVGYRKSNKSL